MKNGTKNWRHDPQQITTRRVQVWTKSGTMAGTVDLKVARNLVADGSCRVLTDQAISW